MSTATHTPTKWENYARCYSCRVQPGEQCRSLKNGEPVARPHKGRRWTVTAEHASSFTPSIHMATVSRAALGDANVPAWYSTCSCGDFTSDYYGDRGMARRMHTRHAEAASN